MRNRLFFLPALAVLLVLAGCGGSESDSSEDGGNGAPQQAVTAVDAADAAQADQSEGEAEAQDQVSGDEEDEGRDAPAPSGDYERALTDILADVIRRTDDEVQRAFSSARLEGVDVGDRAALREALAGTVDDFVPRNLIIYENGWKALEELDPPDRFEEDHNRFIAGRRELTRIAQESHDASLEPDFDFETGFDDLDAEWDALKAELKRKLSPEFLALVEYFFGGAPSGDYERALTNIVDELERRLDEAGVEFLQELTRSLDGVDLDDEEAVNEALAGAVGDYVPRSVSILETGLEALEELDPPDQFEEDHDRFIAGVREFVRLAPESIDAALEEGFDSETSFDDLDALEAELEAELSPEFLALVASFFEDDEEDEGEDASALSGDYERALTNINDDVFRRLLEAGAEFPLSFLASLEGLDPDDDEEVSEVLADASGDFVARVVSIVEKGLVEVEGLDPPDRFEEDHNRFIAGLREIWRLQLEGLNAAFDAALEADSDFETGRLDELNAELLALEAELKQELSPEFRALVGSFFGYVDVEDPPSLADLIGDENITVRQGGVSISVSGQLPDDFPEALIPPAATFSLTVSWEEDGVPIVLAPSWETEQEPSDVLDFYEEALVEAGYVGEQERTEEAGLFTLNVTDETDGKVAVVIATGVNGTTTVIVSLVGF